MRLRFVLAAAALACWFCFAPTACSSFTSEDDPANAEGGAGADARPTIDCQARSCRAETDRYVFMTLGGLAGSFAADAGPGGAIAVANQFCADQGDLASAHPDLAGRSWQAWLCLDGMNADRVVQGEARWIRADGAVLFATTSDLRSGQLLVPIESSSTHVWTGCVNDPFGEASNATCTSWTANTAMGAYGIANRTDPFWSSVGAEACTERHPIYCFESN